MIKINKIDGNCNNKSKVRQGISREMLFQTVNFIKIRSQVDSPVLFRVDDDCTIKCIK